MFLLTLFSSVYNYNNSYNKILVLLVFSFNFILYSYGYCCYNLSLYYQTVNFLNTKNNVVIIILFFYLILFNKKKLTNSIFVNFFFLFIYICFCVDLNQCWLFLFNSKNNININLLNGVMLIHPYILYFFYGMFIQIILYTLYNLFFVKTKQLKISKINKNIILNSFLLIYFSILLGCIWAEQELSWGGWWSWDFVELLALNYLLYFLYKIHKKENILNTFNSFFFGLGIFFLAVLSVRFNIINSVHNFASAEAQNQYYFYILFILFFIALSSLVFLKDLYGSYKFGITTLFLVLVFLLYYLLLHNIILINLIKTTQGIQFNIKHIYLLFIIYFLVLTFLHTITFNKNTLLYLFLFLLLFSYFNIFLIFLSINLLSTSLLWGKNSIKLLHVFGLIFFFLTQQQTYIFYSEFLQINTTYTQIIKTNTNIFVIKTTISDFMHSTCLNIGTYINYDLYKNSLDFLSGLNKNIFEKNLLILENNLFEIYSYNQQKLKQTMGFSILLFLVLTLFYVVVSTTPSLRVFI